VDVGRGGRLDVLHRQLVTDLLQTGVEEEHRLAASIEVAAVGLLVPRHGDRNGPPAVLRQGRGIGRD
jgi:hypothetical protein